MMIIRHAEESVRQKLTHMPAVVLLGPRQVGKTTLARQIAASWPDGSVYLDLERPADRLRLDDADSYLRAQQGKLVILDEIHRAPGVFEILRGIIDDNRRAGQRNGQFLLLGSATLDLMRQSSETLAGRVAYLDIAPLDIGEAGAAGIDDAQLWLRGGFPDSLLAPDDSRSLDWRRDFIRSYLERDVPMFAPRLAAPRLICCWKKVANPKWLSRSNARLRPAPPKVSRRPATIWASRNATSCILARSASRYGMVRRPLDCANSQPCCGNPNRAFCRLQFGGFHTFTPLFLTTPPDSRIIPPFRCPCRKARENREGGAIPLRAQRCKDDASTTSHWQPPGRRR